MNRLEANVSLFIITFFAATQYVFLANVPDSVSPLLFMALTNLIGFLIALLIFFGELFRLNRQQVIQSMVLAGELFGFNLCLMLGAANADPTVSAGILSAYFVFIAIITAVFFHEKITKGCLIAIIMALIGVFMVLGLDPKELLDFHVIILVVCDIFFSIYIITVERYTSKSNPAILAMGQMFFSFLFAGVGWIIELAITRVPFSIPMDPKFWGGALFIGFFIRGLYGIVQIYAQRYISALNTSLIFSSEVLITMLISPVLAVVFGTTAEAITPIKLLGGIILVLGILIADPTVLQAILRRLHHES